MSRSRLQRLQEAIVTQRLMRLSLRYEDSPVRGYVVAQGPKFFHMAVVSDRIWFDGHECFRVQDITSIEPDSYAEFVEAALAKRRQRRMTDPAITLASIRELLESAGKPFPLLSIHREEVEPEICQIGRLVATNRSQVALLEIHADASWDEEARSYNLREITRVGFGASYENALTLVGGLGGA